MNNETFREIVKKLYPIACSTGRQREGAVRKLTRLMQLRKHSRLCKCGCGESIPGKNLYFATKACQIFRNPDRLKAKLLISFMLLLSALSVLSVPPMPPLPAKPPLLRLPFSTNVSPKTYSQGIAWDCSPAPEVTGYKLYHGIASRQYTNWIGFGLTNCVQTLTTNTVVVTNTVEISDEGELLWSTNLFTNTLVLCQGVCAVKMRGLPFSVTNYFAITALTAEGLESDFSNEIFQCLRSTNTVILEMILETADTTQEDWTNRWKVLTNYTTRFVGTTNSQAFRTRLLCTQTNYLHNPAP